MSKNNTIDQLLNISEINREFRQIADNNRWQSYHTPKNLAAALMVEAGELLAEFQWLTPEQSENLTQAQQVCVADEMADILLYMSELAARLDINLAHAVQLKIEKNKHRFCNP